MANRIDLHLMVDRLAHRVGKKEVADILSQFEGMIEGWPNRKRRKKVCETLCVADEADIDGG